MTADSNESGSGPLGAAALESGVGGESEGGSLVGVDFAGFAHAVAHDRAGSGSVLDSAQYAGFGSWWFGDAMVGPINVSRPD